MTSTQGRTTPGLNRVSRQDGIGARLERFRVAAIRGSTSQSETPTRPAYVLFVSAVAAYLIVMAVIQGANFARGQMWAEMATNYYRVASQGSLLEKLFATDAGYIPLPQRLFGMLVEFVGTPVGVIPYAYSSFAYLGAALMVGSIVLPPFRRVIRNDFVRFILAVALAVAVDPETRTYINFTYLAVIPIVFVTALAFVDRGPVPGWAWILPLLVMSKPAVLCVVPAMVLAALFSGPRFRRIAILGTAFGVAQVLRLMVSAASGTSLLQPGSSTLLDKIISTGQHFVAFQTRYLVSVLTIPPRPVLFAVGVVLLVITACVIALRTRPGVVVIVALSGSLFSLLLNCLSYAEFFSRQMPLVFQLLSDRRTVVVLMAALITLAGSIAAVSESQLVAARMPKAVDVIFRRGIASPAVLVIWLLVSGWAAYGVGVHHREGVGLAAVSQWESQADAVDGGVGPVCVPLEPWGWFYAHDCALTYVGSLGTSEWRSPAEQGYSSDDVTIPVPVEVRDAEIASVAIAVRSDDTDGGSADLTVILDDGTIIRDEADIEEGAVGSAVQFDLPSVNAADISSVAMSLTSPDVELAWSGPDAAGVPAALWFTAVDTGWQGS